MVSSGFDTEYIKRRTAFWILHAVVYGIGVLGNGWLHRMLREYIDHRGA